MKDWKKFAIWTVSLASLVLIISALTLVIGEGSINRRIMEGILFAAAGVIVATVVIYLFNKKGKENRGNGRSESELVYPGESMSRTIDMEPAYPVKKRMYLSCRGGYLDGKKFPVLGTVRIGRGPDNEIRYPKNTPGVSRKHATITLHDGRIAFTDVSSTVSYLKKSSLGDNNAEQVPKEIPIELSAGDVFFIGSKENRFELVEE